MRNTDSGRRRRLAAAAAAALLLLAGGSSMGPAGMRDTASATALTPAPGSPAPDTPEPTVSDAAAPAPSPTTAEPPSAAALRSLPESVPETLSIPSIGARSTLIRLGLDDDGALSVPPGAPGSPAGWYEYSPTPGETGPAVLLGHVNAEDGGPGVFADLRRLSRGDRIEVSREDGSRAVFRVLKGEQYSKDNFPTQKVYGNTAGAELRLITCDGYDPKTGHFDDNYVVYAELAPAGP
ncbi:class F sortase [Arthrobacter yangruifuii]|uniref:Class F sortase n=1 Tax=Arthrobacter yangruifuii TaxID=2606616 RepID=A0A5N6MRN1_9MICC|nr:class F sortase [Arthrobacter yangruifuii]KAD4059572.1 class F sortase [Arthrobacter yangruifuii]